MPDNFSLMIHGGAGALAHIRREGSEADFMESMHRILEAGRHVLAGGGTALDAVEICARLLENDPLYNAGHGSVLNEYGEVEMDASIMDGQGLGAGAVAGITNVKNPITLARRVMDKSEHVMLIGKGAMEFAKLCDVDIMTDDYFVIDARIRQWQEAQKAGGIMLDHEDAEPQQIGRASCRERVCVGV